MSDPKIHGSSQQSFTSHVEPGKKGDVSQRFIVTTDLTTLKMRGTVDDLALNDSFVRQLRNKEMGVKDLDHDVKRQRPNGTTAKADKVRDSNLFTPMKESEGAALKGRTSHEALHPKRRK